MTSNQIAAESNRINERHYLATEDLQSDANRINDEHLKRMDAINAHAIEIDQDWKNYQKTLEDRKLHLQERINLGELDIKRDANLIAAERNRIEEDYKNKSAEVAALLANNEVERTNEINRHNLASESIDRQMNDIRQSMNDAEIRIRERALEQQKEQWGTENLLRWNDLNIRRTSFYDNLNLQRAELGLKQGTLQLEQVRAEQQFKRWNFQNATDVLNAVTRSASDLLKSAALFL